MDDFGGSPMGKLWKINDDLAISGIAIDHPIYREVTGVQSQMHEGS